MHAKTNLFGVGLAGLGTTLAPAYPISARFIPNPSQKIWAVLFGSRHGTARDANIWISEGMGGIASVMNIRQVQSDFDQNMSQARTQHPDVFEFRSNKPDPAIVLFDDSFKAMSANDQNGLSPKQNKSGDSFIQCVLPHWDEAPFGAWRRLYCVRLRRGLGNSGIMRLCCVE